MSIRSFLERFARLLQKSLHDVDQFARRLVSLGPVSRAFEQMGPNVPLQNLSNQAVHGAPAGSGGLQNQETILFLQKGSLDPIQLTSDAADPGHQFLLVPDSMRHDSE